MQKQKDENKDINYYEILYRLKDFTCELIEAGAGMNEVVTPLEFMHIELLIAQIRTYIFDVDELKTEFKNRKEEFEKQLENDDYKNKAYEAYKKLKEYAESITPENYKLSYSKGDEHPLALIGIKDKDSKYMVQDKPELYYYPSIVLPFRVQRLNNKNAGNFKLKMYQGINYFYRQFDFKNKFKITYPDENKIKKYFFENHFKKPDNIEFYLSLGDVSYPEYGNKGTIDLSKTTENLKNFNLYFILSCLWYVLTDLQGFIREKLHNPELPNAGKDNLEVKLERLTPAEYEIFVFINEDTTLKNIKDKRTISLNTVNKHLQNISEKLTGNRKKPLDSIKKFKRGFCNPKTESLN